MAITNRTKNQANTVWFFDFLRQYWIVVLAIIFGYPLLKKWYEKFSQDEEEKALENAEKDLKIAVSTPTTKVLEFNKITTDKTLHALAESVAYWLGTNLATKDASWYWWTDLSAITEDEEKVLLELKKVKYGSTVPKVIALYYVITRRDLKADLKKYLSTSELKQVPLFN